MCLFQGHHKTHCGFKTFVICNYAIAKQPVIATTQSPCFNGNILSTIAGHWCPFIVKYCSVNYYVKSFYFILELPHFLVGLFSSLLLHTYVAAFHKFRKWLVLSLREHYSFFFSKYPYKIRPENYRIIIKLFRHFPYDTSKEINIISTSKYFPLI